MAGDVYQDVQQPREAEPPQPGLCEDTARHKQNCSWEDAMACTMEREQPGWRLGPDTALQGSGKQAAAGNPSRVATVEGQVRRERCYERSAGNSPTSSGM